MEFSIIGIITIFIAATIMLSIGTNILGSTQVADCDTLSGAGKVGLRKGGIDSLNLVGATDGIYTKADKNLAKDDVIGSVKITETAKASYQLKADAGWSKSCWEVQNSTSDSYGLLVLIILIIAAVGVLGAIRLLGA